MKDAAVDGRGGGTAVALYACKKGMIQTYVDRHFQEVQAVRDGGVSQAGGEGAGESGGGVDGAVVVVPRGGGEVVVRRREVGRAAGGEVAAGGEAAEERVDPAGEGDEADAEGGVRGLRIADCRLPIAN